MTRKAQSQILPWFSFSWILSSVQHIEGKNSYGTAERSNTLSSSLGAEGHFKFHELSHKELYPSLHLYQSLSKGCCLRKSPVQLPTARCPSVCWVAPWGGRPSRALLLPSVPRPRTSARGAKHGGRGVVRGPAHRLQAPNPGLGGIFPEEGAGMTAKSLQLCPTDSLWPHGL